MARIRENLKNNNVYVNDQDCLTPLHFADSKQIVEDLIRAGADIEARDHLGRTPLYCAVYEKKIEIVMALVKAGADVQAKDVDGNTPLSFATFLRQTEAIDVLRKAIG